MISGKDKDGRSGAGSDTLYCDFRFLSMDGMWHGRVCEYVSSV